MKWRTPVGTFAAAAASTLVVTLAAFGGGPSAAAASTGPSQITLSEGVSVQPNFWFPNMPATACSTENQQFIEMAYRPLLFVGNNDTINYGQSIASGITVSNNDQTYTVHLKSSWKWSNGRTVTAYDALYDAQLLYQTSLSSAQWTQCGTGIGGWPTDIKSMSAPNAYTLVVETTKSVNPEWFELNGLAQIIPIPKSVWDHSPNWVTEEDWINNPKGGGIGTTPSAVQYQVVDGPYKYGPFQNNAYATLVINPHYTGPDPAHIKKITFLYESSDENQWAATLRGVFASVAVPTQYNSQLPRARAIGYTAQVAPYGFCFNYAVPNLFPQDPDHSLLSQLYIRQAIQYGLDQEGFIRLNGGMGFPGYGPVPSIPKTPYYDPHVVNYGYTFNIAKGKKLLEAHGWQMKGGVMTRGNQKLVFNFLAVNAPQSVVNMEQLWKYDLAREGIKLNIISETFNEVISEAFAPSDRSKWQIAWWGGGWCYEPDYMPTGDGLLTPGGGANNGGFNDPHLDQLINASLQAGTPQQVQQRMFAYEDYAAHVLPLFYMPELGNYMVTQKWLHIPAYSWNPVQYLYFYNDWTTSG